MKKDTADAVIRNAAELANYTAEAENAEYIAEPLKTLKESYEAYKKLKIKDGIGAKIWIEKISRSLAYIETGSGVSASFSNIKKNAVAIAAILQKQGQNVTVEDIAANVDGITTSLAIQDFVGKLLLPAERYTKLIREGQMNMEESEYQAWNEYLDVATKKELSVLLGIDLSIL